MTVQTPTLSDFLLARIAETESFAQVGIWVGYNGAAEGEIVGMSGARVLAECEAKRQIVEAYQDERSRRDIYQRDDAMTVEDDEQARRRRSSAARCRGLEIAVELLALPYADHDDYREEWRP